MQVQVERLRSSWLKLPRRAQLSIIAVVALTLVMMFFVLRAATSTDYTQVTEAGLSQDRIGKAQVILEEAGFQVRTAEGGGALEVPADAANKAKAELMTQGIAARGGRTSCAQLFGEGSGMGVSDTSKTTDIKLETCQENQTANDIEQIDGIESASVDVTMADTSLFSQEEQPAKASVVLDTGGTSLSAKAISGIQETVAARFEGLNKSGVSIIDESGRALSRDDADTASDNQAKKLEIESRYNALTEQKLTKQFEKIVGEGNVAVSSNVELDLDAIERQVLENAAPGENGDTIVELEDYEKELLRGAGSPAVAGVPGTATNVGVDPDNRIATPDGTNADGSDGDYVKDRGSNTYAVDKVREDIRVAPGTVLRNRIAVTVNDTVPEASADAINNTIQAWMGGDSRDSMTFNVAPIASANTTNAKDAANAAMLGQASEYLKWILLGIGLVGLAFVVRRSLTERTAELLTPNDDMVLLEAGEFQPIPIAELEAALQSQLPANLPDPLPGPSGERLAKMELQRKVELIADKKPEDVANELRRWMHTEDQQQYSARSGNR